MSQPIAVLPERTVSLLRSSIILPSLPSLLLELVQNSLDASSTSITVHVSLPSWTLRCTDNGHGFDPSHLERLVGRTRYATSKTLEGGSFGFRGEALVSMAEVGALEVVSRRGTEGETARLRVREGVVSFERLQDGQHAPGTTVVVRDIFYKWPVRRKAYSTASSRVALLASLRNALAVFALLHPSISFTLIESLVDSKNTLLHVQKSPEGVLGRWRQLWGRAGVEQVDFVGLHRPVDTPSDWACEGFFGKNASHSKAQQHIFVNSRPLSPSSSPLHRAINTLFSTTKFSRHASSSLTALQPDSGKSTKRKSPKKSAENRHPVFVLSLKIPSEEVDVTLEPEKKEVAFRNEDKVVDYVLSIVHQLLTQNGHLSPSPSPLPEPITPEPQSTEMLSLPSRITRHFSSSRPSHAPSLISKDTIFPAGLTKSLPPVAHPSRMCPLSVPPLRDGSALAPLPAHTVSYRDSLTNIVHLLDSRTGNALPFLEEDEVEIEGQTAGRKRAWEGAVDKRRLRRTIDGDVPRLDDDDGECGGMPGWLRTTLADWENPVFPSTCLANEIPTLAPPFLSTTDPISSTLLSSCHPHHSHSHSKTMTTFFHSSTSSIASQQHLDRSALKSATFINQVDHKFLLVSVPSSCPSTSSPSFSRPASSAPSGTKQGGGRGGGELLLMIDQHAASERVRVEQILKELCLASRAPPVFHLSSISGGGGGGGTKGVPILVGREEAKTAHEQRDEFLRWGIWVDAPPLSSALGDDSTEQGGGPSGEEGRDEGYAQVWVQAVPLVVHERLRDDHALLAELVRSFAAQLAAYPAGAGGRGGGQEGGAGEEGWVSRARGCPTVLLDLVYSKACRGAIMFNDVLTPEQGSKLLAQLAETTFPFVCAHGRPSLVPLAQMPERNRGMRQRRIEWERLRPASPLKE